MLRWLTLQAQVDAERLNTTFEALAEAALGMGKDTEYPEASGSHAAAAAPGAGAGAGSGASLEGSSGEASASESRVVILQRAEAAEQVGCSFWGSLLKSASSACDLAQSQQTRC